MLQKHLLSEMEQAVAATPTVRSKAAPPTTPSTTTTPEIKGMNAKTSPASSPTKGDAKGTRAERRAQHPCKFWLKTDQGCSRGNRCGFAHSMEGISEKEEIGRCLRVLERAIPAAQCPTKVPNDKGKGKGAGKDKAKGKEGTDPKIAAASSTTAPAPSTSTSLLQVSRRRSRPCWRTPGRCSVR